MTNQKTYKYSKVVFWNERYEYKRAINAPSVIVVVDDKEKKELSDWVDSIEVYPFKDVDDRNRFEFSLFKMTNYTQPEDFLKDLCTSGVDIDPKHIVVDEAKYLATFAIGDYYNPPPPSTSPLKERSTWKDIFDSGELNEGFALNNPNNLDHHQYLIKYLENNYYPPVRKT